MSESLSAKPFVVTGTLAVVGAALYYAFQSFRYTNKDESCCEAGVCEKVTECVETSDAPVVSRIPAELRSLVEQWIEWDPNTASRDVVASLLAADDVAALESHFLPRISFGTAGLRSKMDYGYKNMNELVIIQATQGLATFLEQSVGAEALAQGVVIGYDARYNSKTFAETAAAVLLSKGFKVYFFSDYTCTPFVPFGISHLGAAAGIMVTASHNPKDDNGYKVYWGNACQIIPPVDTGIATAILANLKPWEQYQFVAEHPNLIDVTDDVTDNYYKAIVEKTKYMNLENEAEQVKIVYTAMHGVGAKFVTGAFAAYGLAPYIPTPEQVEPNPDFPTVAFPNPEEGRGALALAMRAADLSDAQVILANDPDADRLAVAVKDGSGSYVVLTGNEIAALFAEWSWLNWRKQNPEADPSQCFMVASAVSSKHLAAMAKKEGFQFADTLTGFKWIGNEAARRSQEGQTCLMAYEVEIGFIVGDVTFDKDGVRAAVCMAECANYWAKEGQTLLDRVKAFYETYGTFKMINSYYFCTEASIFEDIFTALRNSTQEDAIVTYDGKVRYPKHCGDFTIASVRDISQGYDTEYDDGKLRLPQMKDSHMITFKFTDGSIATLRNSGTEPKLKYYVESSSEENLQSLAQAIRDAFIKPEVYQLQHKKD